MCLSDVQQAGSQLLQLTAGDAHESNVQGIETEDSADVCKSCK
jgi:hypothetical protein